MFPHSPTSIEATPLAVNADFQKRVVIRDEDIDWVPTDSIGVDYKLVEQIPYPKIRQTLFLRCRAGAQILHYREGTQFEFLVLAGEISDESGSYPRGVYVRNPNGSKSKPTSDDGCLLFVKTCQIESGDQEHRIINTNQSKRWLPGPVDNISVLPLHGWGNESIFLMRWEKNCEFKPRLDPQGEEILVLQGELQDDQGSYPRNSWIRNPITTWQNWRAKAGTIIYYKNGHFPDSAEQASDEA